MSAGATILRVILGFVGNKHVQAAGRAAMRAAARELIRHATHHARKAVKGSVSWGYNK